jgi:hypothetical protein
VAGAAAAEAVQECTHRIPPGRPARCGTLRRIR